MSDLKYVQVVACTWQKETHNLYDNDSSGTSKTSFKIVTSSTIYLENNICKLFTPKLSKFVLPSCEPLLGFKSSQGEFITYQIGNGSSKRLWLAVRYTYPKGFELSEGDVLKLGRIRIKVRKIAVKRLDFLEESNMKCFDSLASQVDMEEDLEHDASCRICFSGEFADDNPLISPCDCIGSMKYIHIQCIKSWLRSKLQTKTTSSTVSYYWNDMTCEVCKSSLPASVYYLGNKIDLISIEYPKKPYILFEEFTPENFNSNGVHIVTIEEGKNICLGRSPDTDFRIADISVSRKHALIHFSNNRFTVTDCKSKFGTLVKMKKVLNLARNRKLSIQVGRTMFHVCVKQKFTLKKCCRNPFKKVAPEWSYITQEGFDHGILDRHNGEVRSNANSISYFD